MDVWLVFNAPNPHIWSPGREWLVEGFVIEKLADIYIENHPEMHYISGSEIPRRILVKRKFTIKDSVEIST